MFRHAHAAILLVAFSTAVLSACIDTTIPDLTAELGQGPTDSRFCSAEDIDSFPPATLRLDFIDVGQGDAILVRTPYYEEEEGESLHVLIDTGASGNIPGTSPGGATVVNYLASHGHDFGRPLDALVITHAHEDHYGGVAAVVAAFGVLRYVDPGFTAGSAGFVSARNSAQTKVNEVNGTISTPATTAFGGIGVSTDLFGPTVISHLLWAAAEPPSGNVTTPDGHDINNTSVVLSLEFGGRRVLLMADAEEAVETMLVDKANAGEAALAADVLKVGHHGSSTASTAGFLDQVFKSGLVGEDTFAIISSGVRSFSGTTLPEVSTVTSLRDRLQKFHVLSTENNDAGKDSGTEHDDDHVVVLISEDGIVSACYGL